MAITETVVPQFPVPRRTAQITFNVTGGNFVRVWVTDAPDGSAFRNSLDEKRLDREQVFEGTAGAAGANPAPAVFNFTPDKSGAYVFAAIGFTQGSSTGGGFDQAATAAPSETIVGSEETITIYVGQRLVQQVGYIVPELGDARGQLVIWIFNDTVRATNVETHGEKTPAIVNIPSLKARTAALDSAVVTALAALEDQTAVTIRGSFDTVMDDFITNFENHRANGTFHANADTFNTISNVFKQAQGEVGFVRATNESRQRFVGHQTNLASGGLPNGDYHSPSSTPSSDWLHRVLSPRAGTFPEAVTLLGDLMRAYEDHRTQVSNPDLHDSSDTTNVLAARPPVFDVHEAYSQALSDVATTGAATDNQGAAELVHTGGFVEETL